MSATATIRIGIYGRDVGADEKPLGCALWPAGYAAAVTAAGGTPVSLGEALCGRSWDQVLEGLQGIVVIGGEPAMAEPGGEEEALFRTCRKRGLPILGVDHGMHLLNTTYGGSIYLDVGREVPEALQHRHPPERGLRHAITVSRGTRLARFYGEGEIVVNSEHRRAVHRVARGFQVSARALDGVIEAIESETDGWFAVGVQWQPASVTASGLDIQLFRGLVEAAAGRRGHATRAVRSPAA
jgi:putative glutamine amidotransferase